MKIIKRERFKLICQLFALFIAFFLAYIYKINVEYTVTKYLVKLGDLANEIFSNSQENNIHFYLESNQKLLKPHCHCLKNESILIEKHLTHDPYLSVDLLIEPNQQRQHLFNLTLSELKACNIACDLYNVLKRGKHQSVLSYSLYGTNTFYSYSLEIIIEKVKLKYKDHLVRIYHDNTINKTLRCYLECKYPDIVDFCNVDQYSSNINQLNPQKRIFSNLNYMHKAMWRFLPIGDTFVDVFMSRDTDSSILDREVDSVRDWLNSTNIGHIMRDNEMHNFKMLAGMWGFRNKMDRFLSKWIYSKLVSKKLSLYYNLKSHENYKGLDQEFLADYVYPLIYSHSTVHDSFFCRNYFNSKPFPTQRIVTDHVGSRLLDNTSRTKECPVACRLNKDWKFC